MAHSNPLADWERVGDRFYRKTRVYDAVFDDTLELENFIVAGAPYGGAIGIQSNQARIKESWNMITDHQCVALYRDESKLSRYRDAQTARSSIDIYSCSGKLISRIIVCYTSASSAGLAKLTSSSGNTVPSRDLDGQTMKNF